MQRLAAQVPRAQPVGIYNNLFPTKTWLLRDADSEHTLNIAQSIGCDSVIMQHKLTKAGYGISLMPESIIKADGDQIVSVLPEFSSGSSGSYFLVNSESYKNPIIKKAVDVISSFLQTSNFWQ